MYDTQQALVAHLSTSGLADSVSAYAGEIQKAIRDRRSLKTNTILVMFVTGSPVAEERRHQFDLLIITRTDSYDEAANLNAGLSLAAGVSEWIESHDQFTYTSYNYVLEYEDLQAELLLQDDRYTIVVLHVPVVKYTHV